jgi:PEP-CTERM motif
MRNLKRTLSLCARIGLGVFVLMATAARPSSASTITFSFSGSITNVNSPTLAGQFAVGDVLWGTYTFDSAAAFTDCGAICGMYDSSLQAVSGTLGTYSFTGTARAILIMSSQYIIAADSPSISGAPVNGLPLTTFTINLFDPTGTALSTAHTVVPPLLSAYSQRDFVLGFGTDPFRLDPTATVSGTITSLAEVQPPTAVPEPTTLLLLGTGIVALAGRARQRLC